jgi:xanthine dehydrogenase accessory factor
MRGELLQLAGELARRGEPFVFALVVRREPTSSAQQGDMAIITADGAYHGWLGGNCTRPAVRREAARALADGKPRYLSLSPEPDPHPRPQVRSLPMTCHSGGTVDIYLEPVLAAERLLLFGVSPCARALGRLGKDMGFAVHVVDPEASAQDLPFADRVSTELGAAEPRAAGPRTHAVVATMGEHDEDAVAAALLARPAYLGVVASRKRWAQLRDALLARGVLAAALDGIACPAGLDLGGRGPEEVALSILAEIVQLRRRSATVEEHPGGEEAIDPVCHMTVAVATARHIGEWDGRTWYFCNGRCREKFLAEPRRYLGLTVAAGGEGR